MPQDLTEYTVTTVSKYVEIVEQDDVLKWFRGAGNSLHSLIPSLYRHPSCKDVAELIEQEYEIIERFKQRSIPFVHRPTVLSDDWDYLFVMQHFGVPTRLLDWTESPFVALYFALTSAKSSFVDGQVVYENDACVWVLRPGAWNNTSLSNVGPPEGVFSSKNSELNAFKPKKDTVLKGTIPVAMYGLHNSERIVAQRGAFVIFGNIMNGMEQIFQEPIKNGNYFPDNALIKIVFPKEEIPALLNKLSFLGITDSSIFPDLEGLAKEIKRAYKFNV